MVLRLMAVRFPQVRLVHQNYIYSDPPASGTQGLTEEELKDVERINLFKEKGWSYASEHTTKPATIAWTVASSPMSLLAWVSGLQSHSTLASIWLMAKDELVDRRKVPCVDRQRPIFG